MGKKKKRRRGSRILGTVGIKGFLVGTVGLTVAKYLAKRFAPIPPRYVNGVAMVELPLFRWGAAKLCVRRVSWIWQVSSAAIL